MKPGAACLRLLACLALALPVVLAGPAAALDAATDAPARTAAATPPAAAEATEWEVGETRQAAPGVAVTLAARIGAFDIWRRETPSGARCLALSQSGRPAPLTERMAFPPGPALRLTWASGAGHLPRGVHAEVLVASACSLDVTWGGPQDLYGLTAQAQQFRANPAFAIGPDHRKIFAQLVALGAPSINVFGHSYQSCRARIGRSDHIGRVSLEGIEAAARALPGCGSAR